MYGPTLPISVELHAQKYRQKDETFDQMVGRLSATLSDGKIHEHHLKEIFGHQHFMPAGRVQNAIGSNRIVTAYNCLSGDTDVLTTEGFRPLRVLAGTTVQILSPISGEVETAEAKSYGVQTLNEIVISYSRFGQKRSGSFTVKATANHRWVLQDGIITDDLKVGQLLKVGDSDLEVDPKGWIHGFVYGDGTRVETANTFQVRLCGTKNRHLPMFEAPDRGVVSITNQPSCNGDALVRLRSSTDLKALPTGGSLAYLRGFVEGLLAADGCMRTYEHAQHFQIHGTEDTIQWMMDHLILAGYAPVGSIKTITAATNFGERTQPLYKINFRPVDTHTGFRVLSITPVGEEEVFCLEEPKHRQFVLRNGLRTGNCFVSRTIEDSMDGIMTAAHEAATTMRMGGGIGYDFSTLRPRGDLIKTLDSNSSGPLSFMKIFDAICGTISSAGHRRGAQMGMLRVDHPDIEAFIEAKTNSTNLTNFNISVAITDEFMMAVEAKKAFPLKFNGQIHRWIDAAELWDKIMQATWDWAEPGVIFIDRINQMNNLWYCETIAATNPCGEQPLPPYGACLLGSFNLVKYVNKGLFGHEFDFEALRADVPWVVRAMDNVVDHAYYPLPQQRQEALSKRRMGLGVTGVANALEACGAPYGSAKFRVMFDEILKIIANESYRTSAFLAEEKGAFPLYDREKYLQSKFVRKLDEDVQEQIRRFGIRNSHLTSIAPTGTISLTADNISSGIEPVFSYGYDRTIQTFDGPRIERVDDYGVRVFGTKGRTADQLSVQDHVSVLIDSQRWVDSAISKTCNVGGDVTFEEFKSVYVTAYKGGAKGCTTFRANGKRFGVLNAAPEVANDEGQACYFDPETGAKSCA